MCQRLIVMLSMFKHVNILSKGALYDASILNWWWFNSVVVTSIFNLSNAVCYLSTLIGKLQKTLRAPSIDKRYLTCQRGGEKIKLQILWIHKSIFWIIETFTWLLGNES